MLLNQELSIAAQKSVEGKKYKEVNGKHVPYANTDEILDPGSPFYIPTTRRHLGQEFRVGDISTYHFVGGIANENLVLRNEGDVSKEYVDQQDAILTQAIGTEKTERAQADSSLENQIVDINQQMLQFLTAEEIDIRIAQAVQWGRKDF